MEDSILNTTKKILGMDPSYKAFDLDVITHINSAFTTLSQLGVGPAEGFMIEDDTAKWSDFLGTDKNLNSVKSYVYLKVRTLFDPPGTPHLMTATENQIKELEVRISTHREGLTWVGPTPTPVPSDPIW